MATLLERVRGYYIGTPDSINYIDPMVMYYYNREKSKESLTLADVSKYHVEITDEEYESLGIKRKVR